MSGRLFPDLHLPADGEVDLRSPIGAFGRYDILERLPDDNDCENVVARSDGFEGLFRLNQLTRLKPALCSDVSRVSRFIEEARLAVRVEHAGTVAVDDFGRVGGVYFIACELVDGVSLEQLQVVLRARGAPMPPQMAAYVVRAVARAVDHAHRQRRADGEPLGLVHGDLRAHHVLITRSGGVKLRGFTAPSIFLQPGVRDAVLGVEGLRSQAPEVLGGLAPLACSDIWSLGVLLWQLLVGAPLFGGGTVDAVRRAVLHGDIPDPSTLRTGIPTRLLHLVETAISRPERARLPSAALMADGIDELLDGARYTAASFLQALHDIDTDEDTHIAQRTLLSRAGRRPAGLPGKTEPAPVLLPDSPSALGEKLARDPGVWGLVRVAERSLAEERLDEARAMFRTAAVLFASRGQLAQALCAWDGARLLLSADDQLQDLMKLADAAGGSWQARQQELARVGGLPYYDALRAQTEGAVDRGAAIPTPFLSALGPDAFARLAIKCRVLRMEAGRHILREGEPGDSLFAVGEGRLVVTCTPSAIDPVDADPVFDAAEEHTDPGIGVRKSGVVATGGLESELQKLADQQGQSTQGDHGALDERQARVFLSALTAGDIFGEFSFLTGRPRSASVEAVTSCRVVELSRRAVGRLLQDNLNLKDAIEAFYKERVLEWMLAKNEVFSLLEPERRRQLLSQCGVYDIPKGKTVVREGELHDAMYFIKRGEVEVTLDDAGTQVFINKLGPGEFFGEIAALEGGRRRASVHAVTDLEAFRITRADLMEVLDDAPEVRERLQRAMRARSDELKQRIAEQRRVLGST